MTPQTLNLLLSKLQNKKHDVADLSNNDLEGCLFASKKALEIAEEESQKLLDLKKIDEAIEYKKSIKEIKKNIKKFAKEFKKRQIQE